VTKGPLTFVPLMVAVLARSVHADEPVFGPNDIPTVFYFSKSDDKNRVDYGLRLDAKCLPVGDDALFPYWHQFEGAPPEHTHTLKFFEYAAYGVSEQKQTKKFPEGVEVAVKLKAMPRPLTLTTERGANGKCTAKVFSTISSVPNAQLDNAFIKLGRGWSVQYVEVHGKDLKTGKDLTEKLEP
jgi:hypothetical protein